MLIWTSILINRLPDFVKHFCKKVFDNLFHPLWIAGAVDVPSLFDGISCGSAALKRTGIEVEDYSVFEIDKYAIMVSRKNYPEIQQFGNVLGGDFKQFKGYHPMSLKPKGDVKPR